MKKYYEVELVGAPRGVYWDKGSRLIQWTTGCVDSERSTYDHDPIDEVEVIEARVKDWNYSSIDTLEGWILWEITIYQDGIEPYYKAATWSDSLDKDEAREIERSRNNLEAIL